MSVYDEIQYERERQDRKWGGPEHDDKHTPFEWLLLIQRFVLKGAGDLWSAHNTRATLIKIAALSVAAIESCDRAQARLEESRN